MPPTKVKIERIVGDRSRQNTFHKRKLGLIKKAIELTVLTDCDCAIILRSAPTVMCPEGRFSAYCNRDLHELIGNYMTEPPSEYYTNAEYPRLAKEGYRMEGPLPNFPMEGGVPAIEVDIESGSHMHAEPPHSGNDSDETKELKKRMADMETELKKFRNLVDGHVISPSSKAQNRSATPVQFGGQHDLNRKRSPPLSFGSFFPIQNEEESSDVQTKRQRQNDIRSEQQQFRLEQQQFRSEQQQESNVYGVDMEQSNLSFLDDIERAQVAPNGLTLRRDYSGSMSASGMEIPRYHPVGRETSWDFSSTHPPPGMNSKGLTPFVTPNLLPGAVPPQCPPFPTEEGNEGGAMSSAAHPVTYSMVRALQRQ